MMDQNDSGSTADQMNLIPIPDVVDSNSISFRGILTLIVVIFVFVLGIFIPLMLI